MTTGSRPFRAKYAGRCASESCRLGGISAGDLVVYTPSDDLVHTDCDTGDDDNMPILDEPRQPAVCGKCNMQHAGDCF